MSSPTKEKGDPNKGKVEPKSGGHIPVAALKRFANELEADPSTNKFLQVNLGRVSEFIDQKPAVLDHAKGSQREAGSLHIPGIYDYSNMNTPLAKPMLQLQRLPEFQQSVGARSRFGEGDGSFFDQWLNADIAKTKHLYDKDGFPLMRYSSQSHSGFKKHLKDYRDNKGPERSAYVKTYAERREERLKREQEEKFGSDPSDKKAMERLMEQDLQPLSKLLPELQTSSQSRPAVISVQQKETSASLDGFTSINVPILDTADLKLPPLPVAETVEGLSPDQKETYFGDGARAAFFENYRYITRQRYTVGPMDEYEEIEAPLTSRSRRAIDDLDDKFTGNYSSDEEDGYDDDDDEGYDDNEDEEVEYQEDGNDENGDQAEGRQRSISQVSTTSTRSRREALMIVGDDELEQAQQQQQQQQQSESNTGRPKSEKSVRMASDVGNDEDGSDRSSSSPSRSRRTPMSPSPSRSRSGSRGGSRLGGSASNGSGNRRGRAMRPTYSRQRINDAAEMTAEEKALLMRHVGKDDAGRADGIRPLSARSKFILGCVRTGKNPHPSLIIRKTVTKTLSISSMRIGNDLAILLAGSLPSLPLLEGLDISDNGLTDVGLVPIVKALPRCPCLKSINLSKNKVDKDTAEAMLSFISSPGCCLVKLIMRDANVDDMEAANFVHAIASTPSIRELDMSHNLLGSHEFSLSSGETAGAALGNLLLVPSCSIDTLRLEWNMIRFKSGIKLVESLKENTSLTYLDLSYNSLAIDGGEMLGDALHSNTSLKILKIANNNITSRACYTILSGIVSCESLKEVDLSKNPIGEPSARYLLSIELKHSNRVHIDIRGCSLRLKDSSCWFDQTLLKKEYSLHMKDPYERAICINLLRLIADPSVECQLESFQYQGEDGAAFGYREIEMVLYSEQPPESQQSLKQTGMSVDKTTAEAQIEEARNMFHNTANELFQKYDTDASGGLDRNELASILTSLGITDSLHMVDKLMTIYDTDGSGLVEEDEFIGFLTDVRQTLEDEKEANISQVSYLYSKEDHYKGVPARYFPPSNGTVLMKLKVPRRAQRHQSNGQRAISSKGVQNMLDSSKASEDRGAIFEFALGAMKLKFKEAEMFYRVMMKELGNFTQVMSQLLPRMITPKDARLMISHATDNDFEQTHHLRLALGPLYNVYMGIPNGYYRLNLSEESDRSCVFLLIQLSQEYEKERKSMELCDTSQCRNWLGFRNSAFEGEPFELSPEWVEDLPEKGRLEFDFVSFNSTSAADMEISNLRLFRLMTGLGMVSEDKRHRVFERLQMDKEEGRASAKGTGNKAWEMRHNHMDQAAKHLHKLYSLYGSSRTGMSEPEIGRDEMEFLYSTHAHTHSVTRTGTAASTLSAADGQGLEGGQPQAAAAAATVAADVVGADFDASSGGGKKRHHETKESIRSPPKDGHATKGETNPSFIRDMMESGKVEPAIVCARILGSLTHALAGRHLTCVQLGLLVERFPEGALPCGEFSTYRVELVISLYSRLVDLINVDYILKELEPFEYGIILFRLGWLNLMSPLKAEGRYSLNLSRPEERQVVRILMMMEFAEPGHSWKEATFREELGKPALPEWHLPVTWCHEATLPSSGVVSLLYFSGKGAGLEDCAPDPQFRHVMMAAVLPRGYASDIFAGSKPTVENLEALVAKSGTKLSFLSEVQAELAGTAAPPQSDDEDEEQE